MAQRILGFSPSTYQSINSVVATRSQIRESKRRWSLCPVRFRKQILLGLLVTASIWSEGSIRDMAGGRVINEMSKTHVQEPRQNFDSSQTNLKTYKVRKRSYLRAQNRAKAHGYTWYLGRFFSAKQLGVAHQPSVDRPVPCNVASPRVHQRKRLTVFPGTAGACHWINGMPFRFG